MFKFINKPHLSYNMQTLRLIITRWSRVMMLYKLTSSLSPNLKKQFWLKNQMGFSRIELTILIFAFVLLASGFLFYVINTTNLTSRQSENAVLSGLDLTNHPLMVQGNVEALTNLNKTSIELLRFRITNTSTVLRKVDLSSNQIIFLFLSGEEEMYLDGSNWSTSWITGHPKVLDPGETVLFELDMAGTNFPISESNEFSLQFKYDDISPVLLMSFKAPSRFNRSRMNLKPTIKFIEVLDTNDNEK